MPNIGERAAASHVPHRIHQLADRTGELGAPYETVTNETDGSHRELGERRGERVDLLHVLELVLELSELPGHRPRLADLVYGQGRLIDDHLGPLDRAADRPQDHSGWAGCGQHEGRDEKSRKQGTVAHGSLPEFRGASCLSVQEDIGCSFASLGTPGGMDGSARLLLLSISRRKVEEATETARPS